MPRILLLAFLTLLGTAAVGHAQSSDLAADSTSVMPNNAYQPYGVTVWMSNLGPDVYTGGTTRITIDIDDPTKPTIEGGTVDGSACQESLEVFLPTPPVPVGGQVSFVLQQDFGPCGLAVVRITSSVEVQGGFTDPNPNNNTNVTDHTFVIPLPLQDWRVLTLLVLLIGTTTLWWMRRRRHATL